MIVVTGALGFIGSNLVQELNRCGYTDLILVDNYSQQKRCYIKDAKYSKLLEIEDFYNNFNQWTDVKIIFHEGACSSTTEKDQEKLNRLNVDFSKLLVNQCIKHDILLSYASSASVYGNNKQFYETAVLDPRSLYAASKACVDRYVEEKCLLGARIQGWRYFNVYGKNEQHKNNQCSAVSKFINQAKNTKKINVFSGSENFYRDFVCVDDVVRIKLQCAHQNLSGIYNLGTGVAQSLLDIATLVAEKYSADICKIPFPSDLQSQYQHFTCADMSKLKSVYNGDLAFSTVKQFINGVDF